MGDELRRTLREVGERVDQIIDEAEGAAAAIRSEATADAERYLAKRLREVDALEVESTQRIEDGAAALRSGLGRIADDTARVVRTVDGAIGAKRR